jgi:hypothetical protein
MKFEFNHVELVSNIYTQIKYSRKENYRWASNAKVSPF